MSATCVNPRPRYPKEPHPQGRSYPQVIHRLSTGYPQARVIHKVTKGNTGDTSVGTREVPSSIPLDYTSHPPARHKLARFVLTDVGTVCAYVYASGQKLTSKWSKINQQFCSNFLHAYNFKRFWVIFLCL